MSGFWEGRDVFVTGATGFIGGRLVREILEAGADVTVLTREANRAEDLAAAGAEVQEGDVTDPDGFAIGDPDTVIHAAAWIAFGIPSSKEKLFRATNVAGTENVLAAAKDAGVDVFCHVSSVAAIGPTPGGLYPEERAVEKRYPEFQNLYAETKHAAHEHVLENHGGMRLVVPMPSVVLGVGSGFQGLMEAFLEGNVWRLTGDNPTGFVHVEDVVEGTLGALEHGEGCYIFNDRNLTLGELWDTFAEASGQPAPDRTAPLWAAKLLAHVVQAPYKLAGKVPPLSVEMIEALEVPLTYSSRRARDELGWEPAMGERLPSDFTQLQSR
jgi:dihydroflavonol-4-reductase